MKYQILILICVLLCVQLSAAHAIEWEKHIAGDKSFSFHYPKGWKVAEQNSTVSITNDTSSEQLLIMALQANDQANPKQIAESALEQIKQSTESFNASDWRENSNSASCHVSFKDKGVENLGDVLVIKSGNQAIWFSYTSIAKNYSPTNSSSLLQGLAKSFAAGESSKSPLENAPSKPDAETRIMKNADAFLFVLEFGLGSPFTAAQEKVIRKTLLDGWAELPSEELAEYDKYPEIEYTIMHADKADVEKMRQTMEQVIRNWLSETDPSDESVKIIKAQFEDGSKILVKGKIPFYNTVAQSWGEVVAFSELLNKNPNATPDQITAESIAGKRADIAGNWVSLTDAQKNAINRIPGIWFASRKLLLTGTDTEKKTIRSAIADLTAPAKSTAKAATTKSSTSTAKSTKSGSKTSASPGKSSTSTGKKASPATRKWAKKLIMDNLIKRVETHTFNEWRWAHGMTGKWEPPGGLW